MNRKILMTLTMKHQSIKIKIPIETIPNTASFTSKARNKSQILRQYCEFFPESGTASSAIE